METNPTTPERLVDSVLLNVDQLRRPVPGGIGTYATGLINGLLQLDHPRPNVTLFASHCSERPDPLRCYALPVVTSAFSTRVMSRLWDLNLVRVKTASTLMHSVSLGGPGANVPLVVTVHDLAWRSLPNAYPPRGRRWHELALRQAARRAAHFVVPSSVVADALYDAGLGVGEDRVTVIEEGADHLPLPDEVGSHHLLRRLGVHGEFLLASGTLEPRKNLARLVAAYATIRLSLPEPWPLIIVGPDGWGSKNRLATPGVRFAGTVSSAVLAGLYRDARVVAYVPLLEGFGLPVVEAMRAGTPVVSSNVPSTGGASLLVDPNDIDSIAHGLLVAATDDARRIDLRERGLARVAPMAWRAVAAEHVRTWAKVAGRTARTR